MRIVIVPAGSDLDTLPSYLLNIKRPTENQSDLRQPFAFEPPGIAGKPTFSVSLFLLKVFPLAHYCIVYHTP